MSQVGGTGSGGGGGGALDTLTGNTGLAVGPDGSANINIVGSGTISVAGNPGTNTLTISSSASASITIDGDSGSASGSTINVISGVSTSNSGKTVQFSGDNASTLTLNVTDNNNNTLIGELSGASLTSGESNTGLGYYALNGVSRGSGNVGLGYYSLASIGLGDSNTAIGTQAMQTASSGDSNTVIGYEALFSATASDNNVAVGHLSLYGLLTGNDNVAIGTNAGENYSNSESNNVLINNGGVATESNTLRIGAGTGSSQQQLSSAYICGIDGVNVGSVAKVVTMASDKLGTATISAGAGISVTPTANTITIAATGTLTYSDKTTSFAAVSNNGYFTTGTLTATLPTSPSQGDIIVIASNSTGLTVQASSGQKIRLANHLSSTAGTAVNNEAGDSLTLVYQSSSQYWYATSAIGNWTIT